ncbi:MAG: hypothetical protein H6898_15650 [Rhodobacter sp.]|nr:hypothetical protein [Paracoccaceae bacterium]MCC0077990.1 hypothetical protein [Rhodobacter sp.]
MFRLSSRLASAFAAFLIAGAALPGAVSAQTVEWRGFAYLSDFSQNCGGWAGTAQVNARFRPSGIGSNGDSSRLSFFDRFYAMNFFLGSGRFTRSFQQVDAGGLGSGIYHWPVETRVRVTRQTPNNTALRATTPQVLLVGQVRGMEDYPDCTFSFRATLLLRE